MSQNSVIVIVGEWRHRGDIFYDPHGQNKDSAFQFFERRMKDVHFAGRRGQESSVDITAFLMDANIVV